MSFDLLIVSLFLLPPAAWIVSGGSGWCFRRLESYFEARFMRKMIANLDRLDMASEEKASAA